MSCKYRLGGHTECNYLSMNRLWHLSGTHEVNYFLRGPCDMYVENVTQRLYILSDCGLQLNVLGALF